MIQVIVNDIEQFQGLFVVTLGNGCLFEFKNLKRAKAFNCQISRFLTQKILIINELHKDLFALSREQWIIAENRGRKGKCHFLDYKKSNDSINDITFWLDFVCSSRCHGAIYSFVCIEKICRSIDSFCDRIDKNYSSFPSYYNSAFVQKIRYVNRKILSEVKEFGLNDCTRIIETTRFQDLETKLTSLKIV